MGSNIYTVGGVGARVPSSMREGEQLLTYFQNWAQTTASPQFQEAVKEAVSEANATLFGRKM